VKERTVNVNSQTLTTTYAYAPNTDQLLTEAHEGPIYGFDTGNERYYAYAGAKGGYYYRDSNGRKIGQFRAFVMGLPSVWSRYLFIFAMALLPVLLFGPAVVSVIRRLVLSFLRKQESSFLRLWIPHQVRNDNKPTKLRFRVPRKGICLFVAFVMLFGPEHFHSLAQGEMQYSDLSTASWSQGDTTIEYTYDANGSVETKTTKVTSTQIIEEVVTNHYSLAGRLDKVTTENSDGNQRIVEYTYNDDGIRIESYSYDIPDGGSVENEETVVYLTDSYNHTGYAQTLEEKTYNGTDTSDTPDSLRTYLIGDDVIAQNTDGDVEYLLYDGHGSTRQLATYDTDITVVDSYSYDGYGVLLQDNAIAQNNPGKVAEQQTNLLYAGEHFDTDNQQYYNRMRWYNPLNGRFNRMDDYTGDHQYPKSLHKYLYCHANPVNATDPSGMMITTMELNISMVIGVSLLGLACTVLTPAWQEANNRVADAILDVLLDLVASGEAAALAAYSEFKSNTRKVTKAIDDVARKLKKTVKELQKFKMFPIIKRLTPKIFDFDVAALTTHPRWFMLNYNGAGSYLTGTNRAWVAGRYGYMRATAPPGYQLDEFPYACTRQGGPGGPALARPVPAWENILQGAYLGAFTRWTLKGRPQPFIVVPISI